MKRNAWLRVGIRSAAIALSVLAAAAALGPAMSIKGSPSAIATTCDTSLLATNVALPGAPVTSEVGSNYNICKASVRTDFSTVGTDFNAKGHGKFVNANWIMARKTVVFKHKTNPCDYAIRTEFVWRGLPTNDEKNEGHAAWEGRTGAPDVLSTSIIVPSLKWTLSVPSVTNKGLSTNGVALRRSNFTPSYSDWDVSPPDPNKPYSGDHAQWKWQSVQVAHSPTNATMELNMALSFRESYRVGELGEFRWAQYGQSVIYAKNTGSCDEIKVKTAYGRTATYDALAGKECFIARNSRDGDIAAALFAFIPFTQVLGAFKNVTNFVMDMQSKTTQLADSLDNGSRCAVRESIQAQQVLSVVP